MSKNYCLNGNPVVEQVKKYRNSKEEQDFLQILLYYDNYKDLWYSQLEDYMDRPTFNSEFDFKLIHAINSYDADHAVSYAEENGLSHLGNFNRWFYKILMNWKSNVKTSAYRLKKRSPVTCPVCGRDVGRIDEDHLQHWKSKKDLPKYVIWNDVIYQVMCKPAVYAVSWGDKRNLKSLIDGKKEHSIEKTRVKWPWRLEDGSRGVLCPFTNNIVPEIDEDYIKSLPDEYSRFAEKMSWEQFISNYPSAMIQSELYSLNGPSDDFNFIPNIEKQTVPNYQEIKSGKFFHQYEHAFSTIDQCVLDETDRTILKLIATGYSVEDIINVNELRLDKKEIRRRLKCVRGCKDLEKLLRN